MPRTPVVTKVAQATKILRGIKSHLTDRSSWLVGGRRYSPPQMAAVYAAHLEAIAAVSAARAALADAIEKERAAEERVKALTEPLKGVVASEFGARGLPWFGWPIPKRKGPKTVAAKVAGVRKRARGSN